MEERQAAMTELPDNIEPNVWFDVGDAYAGLIDQKDGKWRVWVLQLLGEHQFLSAWNLDSEKEAADNLRNVVATTYGGANVSDTNT